MPQLSTRGASLYYDLAGDGGSPVLLIMGYGMPCTLWDPQVPELAGRHRVARFDNRGAGRTQAAAGLYSMRHLADDARALMDHLGWDRAHVVGVSMGGMIAQELALRHRDRLLSLGLVATHAGGALRALPTPRGLKLFVRSTFGPASQRLPSVQQLLYPEPWLATRDPRELGASLREAMGPPTATRYKLSQLAAILRHRTSRRLRALDGLPTLVVKPSLDVLIAPRESDRLHRLIPGSRLVEFSEAGHGVLGQCTERVNAELLAHFSRADRPHPPAAASPR